MTRKDRIPELVITLGILLGLAVVTYVNALSTEIRNCGPLQYDRNGEVTGPRICGRLK